VRHPICPILTIVALLLVLAGLPAAASAKADPAIKCAAFKLKGRAQAVGVLLGCHALAAKKGVAPEAACLTVPLEKLAAGFEKAEAAAVKAGSACRFENDAAATQAEIEAFLADVVAALHPGPEASKCGAKKLGIVGKHAVRLLNAHAKHLVKPATETLVAAVDTAEVKLASDFAKAEDKSGNDCQSTRDAEQMRARAAALVDAAVCSDGDRCTIDTWEPAQSCRSVPVVCAAHEACDFRSGTCAHADCCLMSTGPGACVVSIPVDQIANSASFCAAVDAAKPALTLLSFGPSCVGWRAAGFDDCP